ncbi:MAG: fumarate hydratase [Thermodesulfobacteriota bacterium]
MRNVSSKDITEEVKKLCIDAAYHLGEDVCDAIKGALETEKSPLGKDVLSQIVENFEIADSEDVPMCQDTGLAVFFVEIGSEVALDGPVEDAINEGVRQGYEEGYLRKSVCDPFSRKNTGDNTPAIIHTAITAGDKIRVMLAAKGGGSENMSGIAMLKPAQGLPGVKEFVVRTIRESGGNPCPPIIVGVGIGGNFEKSAIMSKRSLFRKVGEPSPIELVAMLEKEILFEVNALGVGPMGFGGTTTALAVHIDTAPCHIASFPVAVNVQCHADRHKEIVI